MPSYVQVAVNVPQVSGVFDYHLPDELEGKAGPGLLVAVPFGAQTVQGIIVRTVAEPQVPSTKPVAYAIDPDPVVTPAQLRLAQWLADQTLSTLATWLDHMLPPGLSQRTEVVYTRLPDRAGEPAPAYSPLQTRILAELAERGPLRSGQMEHAFKHTNWRASVQSLARQGKITARSQLPEPKARPRMVRTVQLSVSPEAARQAYPSLARGGSAALVRRQALLDFLIREPWPVDAPWVYAQTGAQSADLEALAKAGLVSLGESEIWRDPLAHLQVEPDAPPALTPDQEQVWQSVRKGLYSAANGEKVLPYLLHGVTGSGKTEIYLHAVEEVLRQGKQAIVLVPEIALTPQTVRRFMARFPGQVGLVHHRLSDGERYDTWRRARRGELPVIVGPRSALFMPLPNLGLIVVDEAHDDSYYQNDIPPFYHAVRAAAAYAYLSNAVCLVGSATPDVVTMYQAENGRGWQLLRLPLRILAHRQAVERQAAEIGLDAAHPPHVTGYSGDLTAHLDLPQVELVDMREELKADNRSIFSRSLQRALGEVLERKQQAILFLNRRGSATFVFCRSCGYSLRCPRCDIPLTLHAPRSILTCHLCGYQRQMPTVCPLCGKTTIRQFGTGTEKVESEVLKLYPQARVMRWDAETTRQKGAHELILEHFAGHHADILVGTQMLAKGLDLPLVTLVGVVLADVGLNLPDYHAAERTFQVLTQVAGRAGRSLLGGRVVLQTFQPEHYVIQAASRHAYQEFYRHELDYRRKLGYPPFYHLVRLEYRHRESARAEEAATALAAQLDDWIRAGDYRATSRIGPAPCFYAMVNGIYRWQIILRGPDPAALLRGRSLGDWRIEVDPPSLL